MVDMPRSRPQLSITLPRNFQFHYTEGNEPKTPENEGPVPAPRSPRAEGAYRIKRRSRPSVNTALSSLSARRPVASDVPIPTIETFAANETTRPPFLHAITEPSGQYLAPRPKTLPRTPSPTPQKPSVAHDWDSQKYIGETISRPMSACSLISDSSDDNDSLTSYPTGDGSCTSPESDSPDPFSSRFTSIKRGKGKQIAVLLRNDRGIQDGIATKPTNRVQWTSEMDKHLWSTYLIYLQDPTVTPFKMLPGTSPPLGVCHRVAREARRTWRPANSNSNKRKASVLLSPNSFDKDQSHDLLGQDLAGRPGSPDTIKPVRSGSNTPTKSVSATSIPPKSSLWPKSGSSTRRRLRYLSKRKPSIAPHYRRLLQSRSPSPFSSSSRVQSRSQSRLSEVTSPETVSSSPFNTRDIQFSLTTSTADTMQPDGPLAQLSKGAELPSPPPPNNREWFNEPPVPFASGPAIPSDVANGLENGSMEIRESIEDTPRLGSPFNGYHTWGPSRTKQRTRPSTARIQSSDAMTMGPSLRSPVRFSEHSPQGIHKRRARHQLEDELSPGGSSMQQSLLDNLFGSPSGGRHRRVRSRGFSLGDVDPGNPLASIFTPPGSENGKASLTDAISTPANSTHRHDEPVTPTPHIRRLGSPFNGIAPRPQRTRGSGRHMAAASLGQYDLGAFSSIGETLQQGEVFDRTPGVTSKGTNPF